MTRAIRRCETWRRVFGVLVAMVFSVPISAQTFYQKGDKIEEFTLTNRATGEPLRLSDFEGKIVFLEWFAWW